jgi:hypothetical protein
MERFLSVSWSMNFSNLIEQMAGMIYFHVDFQLNPKESKVDNLVSRIFALNTKSS